MDLASEFCYGQPIFDKKKLYVFVSQSGETADTLAALRLCLKEGMDTLAIVSVQGSSLAKEAKYGFIPKLERKYPSLLPRHMFLSCVF